MTYYNYCKPHHAGSHPANGLNWLYLQESALRQLDGGPPQVNPDPHQSGQNPEYTTWAWEKTKCFAKQAIYLKQIQERLSLLDKRLNEAKNDIAGAQANYERLKAERDAIADLIV